MWTVFLLVMVVTAWSATTKPCEDAAIDCAAKDQETNICSNPVDSMAYCPRYCGLCQGSSSTVPGCQDYDVLCPALLNSSYCTHEIAYQLCPKTCGLCVATLHPHCRDLDPGCQELVANFSCETDEPLRRLCPNTCGLCVNTTHVVGGVTLPDVGQGCVDHDPKCPDLDRFCGRSDMPVNLLCPKTCNTCSGDVTTMEPTEPGPLMCRLCVDPFCDLDVETMHQCSDDAPFCSSLVINNADGTRALTKRCASKAECDRGYTGTAAGSAMTCASFDPSHVIQEQLECLFCCTRDECNRHIKPHPDSLYTPT